MAPEVAGKSTDKLSMKTRKSRMINKKERKAEKERKYKRKNIKEGKGLITEVGFYVCPVFVYRRPVPVPVGTSVFVCGTKVIPAKRAEHTRRPI